MLGSRVQATKDVNEREGRMTTAAKEAAWITYSAAQVYAGLGRTKLWELVSTGEVEAARVGRAVRISRRSLDEYMKRNRYVAADS
jgi:excisionase family DNA binding protein